MKNHRFSILLLLVFLVGTLSLGVTSCKGKLEGTIFLDDNADNAKQDDESLIANLRFNVTLDDEEIDVDDAQTDAEGNFSVSMKGKGTYCVEVSSDDLAAVNDDGTSPSIVAALTKESPVLFAAPGVLPLFAESDCSDDEDDDADGDTDCDDSDCSSDDVCTGTETDCDDETDNDEDGDTDCDDSDCSSDDACDGTSDDDEESDTEAVTESGRACDDSGGMGLTLTVPIAKDYSSGFEDLDTETHTTTRGETIPLDFIYPASCTFDIIYLPTSLTAVGVPSDSYVPETGQFNFNTAISGLGPSISEALVVNQDFIGTFELEVTIEDDGATDDKTLTITPTVTCPDDSSVTLQTHSIEVTGEDET